LGRTTKGASRCNGCEKAKGGKRASGLWEGKEGKEPPKPALKHGKGKRFRDPGVRKSGSLGRKERPSKKRGNASLLGEEKSKRKTFKNPGTDSWRKEETSTRKGSGKGVLGEWAVKKKLEKKDSKEGKGTNCNLEAAPYWGKKSLLRKENSGDEKVHEQPKYREGETTKGKGEGSKTYLLERKFFKEESQKKSSKKERNLLKGGSKVTMEKTAENLLNL